MVELFQTFLDNLNYWYVFIFMTIESTIIPFPSEVVVPPAAYMAAHGQMNVFLVVLYATLGADLGAAINYWGAYYLGRPLVYSFARSKWGKMCLLDESKIQKSEEYFDRHGITATLIGRLTPVIRQLISVPAGLARMNFGVFMLYTTIGAGAWNIILAGAGYYLGTIYDYDTFKLKISEYSHIFNIAFFALVGIVILYFVVKHSISKSKK